MEWFIENWTLILTALIVVAMLVIAVIAFFKLPVAMQKQKVKEWLLWAVTECERQMGGGVGALKLRTCYDWFLSTFKWISRFVSFEMFSAWVDEALERMRYMLETNKAVANYVSGETDE